MDTKQNRSLWWIIGGILVVSCCCCAVLVGVGGMWLGITGISSREEVRLPEATVIGVPAPTPENGPPSPARPAGPTATPPTTPGLGPDSTLPTAVPAVQSEFITEQELASVVVPARDLQRLAEGLRGTGPIPDVLPNPPGPYAVGDREEFWVFNSDTDEKFQIEGTLVYVNDVLYMWVESGIQFDINDIEAAADRFAQETYPTNRNFFGSEWSPGIDGDPRLHILHATQLGDSIAGYFSGADEVSNLAQPFSNQREMFYINIGNTPPDSPYYNSVLAHEFQHMIHWYQDQNESTWVNEGMSELATELNDLGQGGFADLFSQLPDTQLNAWSDDPAGAGEHYGSAYLFMSYFLQRFGNEMTQAVVASDANDIGGFNDALKAHGESVRFNDVFADWLIANYLDRPDLADGRYGYQRDDIETMAIDIRHRRYPVQREAVVHQYAADFIELRGSSDLVIDFQGATTNRLALNEAHSGQFAWWANRVDDSDARLTRAFDLGAVETATLRFWTWFDIEDDYDYAYVMASADGGSSWTPLATEDTTDENPNGNSFGSALTGCSGDSASQQAGDDCNARWIEQSADLTPFAGQEILLRFQYITDDAVNYPGFFVDDVTVPEIGYSYDAEGGDEGWVSEGWIRTDNILRQQWLVQLIELEDGQDPVVTRLPVDEAGRGRWTVDNLSRRKDAILVVSALAPVTTELAPYSYTIETR